VTWPAEALAWVPGFDRASPFERNAVESCPPAPSGPTGAGPRGGEGKAIESGIILSEPGARGLARRVLTLVPAPLAIQWGGGKRWSRDSSTKSDRDGRPAPLGGTG